MITVNNSEGIRGSWATSKCTGSRDPLRFGISWRSFEGPIRLVPEFILSARFNLPLTAGDRGTKFYPPSDPNLRIKKFICHSIPLRFPPTFLLF